MTCKICGDVMDSDNYLSDVAFAMDTHQMCFHCNFWREMLEKDAKRPSHTWCMIDGTHYVIEPDDPSSYFQGFGGAEFQIEFNDGHRVITHNLWCQGEPPKEWIDKFPNNARFERNLKWKQVGGVQALIEEIPDELISQAETLVGM